MNQFRNSQQTDGTENLFFEKFLGRYFWKRKEEIILAEYNLNKLFTRNGIVYLHDFYNFLGISEHGLAFPRDYGWEICGTNEKGYGWIDFSHRFIENKDIPYYVIDYPCPPFDIELYSQKGEIKCLG